LQNLYPGAQFLVDNYASAGGFYSTFFGRPTGFVTFPDRRHCVQTFMRTTLPPTCTRIFCTFGLKVRFVIPVVFFPTPPLYFARPLRATLLPTPTRFPQISHALDIS
jgi:hypothetical protein